MSAHELRWDDEIENDAGDFVVLPEGEYPFRVVKFTRGRYAGGAKIGPCPKAELELEFDGGHLGKTTIRENLFLHTKTEGLLCAFFRSIGARKSGEKLQMNWGSVMGATGIAKIGIRKYRKKADPKDAPEREINQVERWIDPPADSSSSGEDPGYF